MVSKRTIYSCERCGAEFPDEIDAEDCEAQIVPDIVPRGSVFVEELPKEKEHPAGRIKFVVLEEADGLAREHLRAYHADVLIFDREKGKIENGSGVVIVSRDGASLDSAYWPNKISEHALMLEQFATSHRQISQNNFEREKTDHEARVQVLDRVSEDKRDAFSAFYEARKSRWEYCGDKKLGA